jgi:hypothetical protein
MIQVVTSHNHIWNIDQVVTSIIHEYQQNGSAVIYLNGEGPCSDSVGLYRILDNVCNKFQFDKSKITINTHNAEEFHSEYIISLKPQFWLQTTKATARRWEFSKDDFIEKKQPTKNLFGCLYNIPSWNRLCLLSYIRRTTKSQSLLACNGTWQPDQHNTYYLNPITDFCPNEVFNIVEFIKQGIAPLPEHPGHKPDEKENTKILKFYNDFFIDMVAETYTNGLTFSPTEKTIRPMYALTPFVIFGPQGFLSNLKSRYGFKTFEQWWDESYDDYQNYERITKIYKVIDYLDSLSMSDREAMYKDMQPILLHNYQTLIDI